MARSDSEKLLTELRDRYEKLPERRQEQAMKAFMDALTLCELPTDPGESTEISVSLKRSSDVTYRSG